MTTSLRMDAFRSHMTERILDLTLEIIYLLTGEDYEVVKKTSGEMVTPNSRLHGLSAIKAPPLHSLIPEKKILDVIHKIAELLTGEVSGVGDAGTLSRNSNSPEGWTAPLYSQDSAGILHHYQGEEEVIVMKVEVKKEEETGVKGDLETMEKKEDSMGTIKEEGEEETCVRGDQRSSQEGDMMGAVKEETYRWGDQPSTEEEGMLMGRTKEEGCPLNINPDGRYVQNHLASPPVYAAKDNSVTQYSPGGRPITGNAYNRPRHEGRSLDLSNPQESSDRSQSITMNIPPTYHHVDWSNYLSKSKSSLSMISPITQGGEKVFPCPVCDKSFTRKTSLVLHHRLHTGERPYSCSECGKGFIQKRYLLGHQRSHTGERPFSCPDCGKSFNWKEALLRHQKSHMDGLNMGNPSEGHFATNTDAAAEDNGVAKNSPEMGNRLQSGEGSSNPEESSDGSNPTTRNIPPIGGTSNEVSSSKGPSAAAPAGEKTFRCHECNKCFKKKSTLVLHHKLHTGERPFSCSECGKGFIQKRNLLIHLRSHTGERPFSCSECGKRFFWKEALLTHQKQHTGERPYSCSECGKGFIQREHLLVHQRSHTGERPFSCSECGKSFLCKRNLVLHQTRHDKRRQAASFMFSLWEMAYR